MQAIALGYISSLEEGRKIIADSHSLKEFLPDNSDDWASAANTYKKVVEQSSAF